MGYGDAVRRLRNDRGWSQPDLAKKAHTNVETVVRAEQSGNVTIYKLQQLALALSVDVSAFFGAQPAAAAPPPVWERLTPEQRAYLESVAYRLLGERAPTEGGQ